MAALLVTVGSGISLLFIYTGGNLDQRSIERALPILQQDVENTVMQIGKKVDYGWQEAQRTMNPILKKVFSNQNESYRTNDKFYLIESQIYQK